MWDVVVVVADDDEEGDEDEDVEDYEDDDDGDGVGGNGGGEAQHWQTGNVVWGRLWSEKLTGSRKGRFTKEIEPPRKIHFSNYHPPLRNCVVIINKHVLIKAKSQKPTLEGHQTIIQERPAINNSNDAAVQSHKSLIIWHINKKSIKDFFFSVSLCMFCEFGKKYLLSKLAIL